MSRLFYERARVGTPDDVSVRRRLEVRDPAGAKRYLEKVAKLVPSEVIAAYVTVIGLVPLIRYEGLQHWLFGLVVVVCLVLTPLYLNALAEPDRPKRNHLILSTVAFVVWAYAVSGGAMLPQWHDPALASIMLALFSLVSGVIPLDR